MPQSDSFMKGEKDHESEHYCEVGSPLALSSPLCYRRYLLFASYPRYKLITTAVNSAFVYGSSTALEVGNE